MAGFITGIIKEMLQMIFFELLLAALVLTNIMYEDSNLIKAESHFSRFDNE